MEFADAMCQKTARGQDGPQAEVDIMWADDEQARQRLIGVHELIGRHTGGPLPVRLWDGSTLGPEQAPFRIVLEYPWSLRSMLLPPTDLAAGEAYIYGDVDVEGDMVAGMRAVQGLSEHALAPADRLRIAGALLALPRPPRREHSRRVTLRGRVHDQRRDRAAIAWHYDLPQEFYNTFLDPELVYSCAYFADGDDDLAAAQRRKLDLVCRKLRLRPGMRLLDIGCGWGSLLAHAAAHYGVTGVGVTLSETQLRAGRARLAARGLSDRVELRQQDYRDVDERFDAVASIGMVEHVGANNLRAYMATAKSLLVDGGLFLCHGIVTNDLARNRGRRKPTFINTYVFPDGELTPVWRSVYEAERAGLELLDVEQLRPHYARTLRAWVANLEDRHEHAVAACDDTVYRIWRAYMAGSAIAFESRRIGVVQLLCGRHADVPLGRQWMLPADRDQLHRAA